MVTAVQLVVLSRICKRENCKRRELVTKNIIENYTNWFVILINCTYSTSTCDTILLHSANSFNPHNLAVLYVEQYLTGCFNTKVFFQCHCEHEIFMKELPTVRNSCLLQLMQTFSSNIQSKNNLGITSAVTKIKFLMV